MPRSDAGRFSYCLKSKCKRIKYPYARLAELADALDLGSNGATRAGSIPVPSTNDEIDPAILKEVGLFLRQSQATLFVLPLEVR